MARVFRHLAKGFLPLIMFATFSSAIDLPNENHMAFPKSLPGDIDLEKLEKDARAEVDVGSKAIGAGEKYNYDQVLELSLLFYEAQRSGKLPPTNRVHWRGDSALQDGKDKGLDLSGGWYDAGDHIKFSFPMAYSTTVLAWGIHEYEDAYNQSGELANALDGIKWPLDFLIKAHPDPDTFYVQVGDGDDDHNYWGSAEGMNMNRPAYAITKDAPGSEYAGEGAAALAAGSVVFKTHDSAYAAKLLNHAKSLFTLAYDHQGTSTISEPFYKSWSGFKDELAWAALWIYQASGDKDYLDKAEALYGDCCSNTAGGAFSWDTKSPGVQLLLYKLTKKAEYAQGFQAYMDSWLTKQRTPKGLAFYNEWAPNRYASNTAFLALVGASYGLNPAPYREFAESQINYILGDCCGGLNPQTKQPYYSYLIGYGDRFPRSPHHRGASCGSGGCACGEGPEPHILFGALVGGPGINDDYSDKCDDYVHNEVATDYNAGFTSAVAGLKHLSLTKQLPHQ